jgi:hypothetical protein
VIDSIVEQPLERIEKFMKRTGIIGEETAIVPSGEMIKLPPKPTKSEKEEEKKDESGLEE